MSDQGPYLTQAFSEGSQFLGEPPPNGGKLRYQLIGRLGHGLEARGIELVDGHQHADSAGGGKGDIAEDAF